MGNVIPPPLGMFDLDADGTILRYHAEWDSLRNGWRDLAGRNFYDVMAAFDDAGELRRRVEGFLQNGHSAAGFDPTCRAGGEALPVRVLLARVGERYDLRGAMALLLLKRAGDD